MTAITPRYAYGPITFPVSTAVVGGMLVDAVSGGTVAPSAAGSFVCVGVALSDAIPAATSQTPTVPGAPVAVNLAPYPSYVAVANFGVWPVTFAAATTFGARCITAANGQATPAGAAPDARSAIGVCVEPGGVGAGAVGALLINLV